MRPNPYIVQTLKYATLTLLGCAVIVAGAALLRNKGAVPLAGRLTPPMERGVVPTQRYEADRAINGFSAPADTHVIFTVPQGTRIPRITFLGGPEADEERYWGYCFSGNEVANKAKGYIGKQMYDGQYFYSLGERKVQVARPVPADNNLQDILTATTAKAPEELASIAEIFHGGQTCYVMSSVILSIAVDNDGDHVNNAREHEERTDPNNPDTDGDGIIDGVEIYETKTNPLQGDTDKDGLSDRCEDKNMNGEIEVTETSALVSDTDRDGLCDGNGSGNGCPEPREVVCFRDSVGERQCMPQISSPVFGEDMNQNCQVDSGETDPRNRETFGRPDWDYKWSLLQSPDGSPQTDSAKGVDAPEFPIPSMPTRP
ncbi:MAG: hypothetical protein KBC47_03990 [Candidatus Peribacteraceae bacterium]|nr:hypothetical protein [Candidatus Peribacteraceae bacterium]